MAVSDTLILMLMFGYFLLALSTYIDNANKK